MISADHIATIAAKCPRLKKLKLFKVRLETWPQLSVPWALEELVIYDHSSINRYLFTNDSHYFPNELTASH